MKVYVLNDTSKSPHTQHAGCKATMEAFYAWLKDHEIIGRHCAGLGVDYELIEKADAVICNGEGTMHHNSKSMQKLMDALKAAQWHGKKTALVNSVWDSNDEIYKKTLEKLDFLSFREVLSQKSAGIGVVRQDLVFNNEYLIPEKLSYVYGGEQVFTDKTLPLVGDFQDLINEMAKCKLFKTSKYHGVILAMISKTPFEVLPGATSHKIEGLLLNANHFKLSEEDLWALE